MVSMALLFKIVLSMVQVSILMMTHKLALFLELSFVSSEWELDKNGYMDRLRQFYNVFEVIARRSLE